MSDRSVVREYLEALLIAGLFLGFTNTFILKTFYIPSQSMVNTLLVGDHLFVNRLIFGSAPSSLERALLPMRPIRRGDIVIFRSVEEPKLDLVKRCIGLPGDTVEEREKVIYINGKQVDDSTYAIHGDARVFKDVSFESPQGRQRDNFGPIKVPDAHYFCMGDNRDFSYDSRYWGPVPLENVKGRPVFIYWSYGGETPDGKWHGWAEQIRQLAGTAVGFFSKTRWDRTFHLVR